MRKITKRKVESIRRKFECDANESPRDKICRLIDAGSVDVEEALLSCVQAMSEDDCEHVLKDLALAALEGDCADCEDEVSVEVDDLDDAMPGDDEIEEPDMDEEDEDEDVEEDDTDEADESCSKRRQLERRIRRMERLMKNEKGLFDFFRKKKEPAETKLDLKTFQRMGKEFLEKICDSFKYDYKPSGRVEARSSYVSCGWMNGAQMLIHFNNGSAMTWSMIGSDNAIEKSMPKGNIRIDDDELKFADSKDWNRIRNALKVQSDFTREENIRRDKQWAKDRAAADAARAKQNRKEDDWFSKRMNPYTTDWL